MFKKNINKKKVIKFFLLIAIFSLFYYYGVGIKDYLAWEKTKSAIAASSLPWQDAGKITLIKEPCVLDTPTIAPVTCESSCPNVTTAVGTLCASYIEINTESQKGTLFIAAPITTIYKGGGSHPVAGMKYIAGGMTNASPYVIGIPSSMGSTVQRLVDSFKVFIASVK
jgi:hypothetical protein